MQHLPIVPPYPDAVDESGAQLLPTCGSLKRTGSIATSSAVLDEMLHGW
jgi:hypothetical protein